jgi:hypothetical protein
MPTKDELNGVIADLKEEIITLKENCNGDNPGPQCVVPMFWTYPIDTSMGSTMDVFGTLVVLNDDGYYVGMVDENTVESHRNREGERFLTENEYADFLEDVEEAENIED